MMPRFDQLSALCSLFRHLHVGRDKIVAFQNRQLRRLIAHAYNNVPYYRRLFDQHGVKPQDIRTVADLPAIPITSRQDLQQLPIEEVVACGVDPQHLIVQKTSGSSGMPLSIRRTWFEERFLGALRMRALYSFGLRLRDKRAQIVLVRPTHARDNQLPLRVLQTMGLYRVMKIDCLQAPEDIVRTLRHVRPDVVTGFSGVLARVAEQIDNDDRRVICPRFVAVGGEVLTPLMRHQIAAAFRAPVFEIYGSHEFNLLAWQCKETGDFHTCDDGMILEVLKDDRPVASGEQGEVVGTNLHAFAMPFIRYRLGDLVTKGSETCLCGQPYSTIRAIQGRMIDYFPLPGGRAVHPYEIVSILLDDAASWVRHYQLLQERADRIILQVVPSITPTPDELTRLEEAVTTLLGRDVEFRIVLVPEIRLEPSGKFRVSRSLVHSAYDGIDWDQMQAPGSHSVIKQNNERD